VTPAHTRARGPGRGCTAWLAIAAALLLLPVASASAQSGGTPSTPKPRIASVSCPRGCDEFEPGRAGDALVITGRWLESVSSVVFLGGAGAADDVGAGPREVSSRRLRVTIPRRARTGPVRLVGADGMGSRPSRYAVTLGRRGPMGLPQPLTSGPITAQLGGRAAFYDGRRPAQLTYTVLGAAPADVRVDLVRVADGTVVARWGPAPVGPNSGQTVTWNGLGGNEVAPDGRYRFDVFTGAAAAVAAPVGAAASQAASPTVSDTFLFLSHVFPIRGRHDYGVNVNRFGPISGRDHRGQDVLAACGTPLVAARGGRVKVNSFQGAAGNYLVIDEEGSRFDHAYLHLRERAIVRQGERVRTGQRIGYVGTTGNSTACHLHFELWDGPWWGGGHPIDPLPSLKAWDRASALVLQAGRGR
jgi:murein DD-endopeptidase MepM/ murein hydrolase activator NlpD